MTRSRPTLQIYILALFLVFLFASAGVLTWFNYRENAKAALVTARELLVEVNERVLDKIRTMSDETFSLTREAVKLQQFVTKEELMGEDVPRYLVAALEGRKQLYSAYVGYANGDFCQVISLRQARKGQLNRIQAPDEAELAVRKVYVRPDDGQRVESWIFTDRDGRPLGSGTVIPSEYDPRERAWFVRAMETDGFMQTGYYVFDSTGSFGLSVAHRIGVNKGAVFGVDITVDDLSGYFARQRVGKRGVVFVFDQEGRLIVHPDVAKTVYWDDSADGRSFHVGTLATSGDPLLLALNEELQRGDVLALDSLDVNGAQHLIRVTRIRDERIGNQYIAVSAPASDFTESLDRTRLITLLFAGGICLLAVGMAVYFSRLISRPLRQLAEEADEIRRFNLDSPVSVTSSVAEVFDLTRAITTMKSSLSTFGRYVPKALVRQILLKHLDPELGGERRELTLLFSDMANFTSISESMNPEELMLDMSEYLQVIGSEIQRLDGTIDKFIGDAVMAFWNAPNEQEDHASLACEAALMARRANRMLNREREGRGVPPLKTRFGLHTGEVVIGNVGTEDRMNYTAVGSAVNLASRLEGVNKFYGTSILVSETVRERVGERFVFRSVGKVMPKGTSIPVIICELLGVVPDESENGIAAPQWALAYGPLWEKAFAAYQEHRFKDAERLYGEFLAAVPGDGLGGVMAGKARQYMASPPGPEWDGVDVFQSK